MQYKYLNIIGLMSGTSMDGIDISLVKTNGLELKRLNKNYFYEYNISTKKKLMNILREDINLNLNKKKFLDELITNEHYLALKDLNILNKCDVIGFHGQTIYHNPKEKISIQLGDPKILSKKLNKKVVFDFRSNDIAFGGQGAPLAPIYHKLIIEKFGLEIPSCILNIGGVANLTYWDGQNLIGFDTGPGNALMDDFSKTILNKSFDNRGHFASQGTPIKEEVTKFLQDEFFKKIPPKSLDRNSFITNYKNLTRKNYSDNDVMATLLEFTLESILISLEILPQKIKSIIVTGGGYKNSNLIKQLSKRLELNFLDEKELGIEFDYIEAELIAYLSARAIYKLPFTFPSTTGVSKPCSGGELYEFS